VTGVGGGSVYGNSHHWLTGIKDEQRNLRFLFASQAREDGSSAITSSLVNLTASETSGVN